VKVTAEALAVKLRGGAFSADLGNSSKYSSEILELRSGKGFLEERIASRVSQS